MLLILVFTGVAILCTLGWYLDARQRAEFRKKFPPLTDEEFVERCGSGTDRDVALKVRNIISAQLGIPAPEIYPEYRFVDDLHAD